MKNVVIAGLMAATVLAATVISAQEPVENISGHRHRNLAEAQHLSRHAWDKVVAAQKANEWDMNGHAQKAKDLLVQVNIELKEAAEAANRK